MHIYIYNALWLLLLPPSPSPSPSPSSSPCLLCSCHLFVSLWIWPGPSIRVPLAPGGRPVGTQLTAVAARYSSCSFLSWAGVFDRRHTGGAHLQFYSLGRITAGQGLWNEGALQHPVPGCLLSSSVGTLSMPPSLRPFSVHPPFLSWPLPLSYPTYSEPCSFGKNSRTFLFREPLLFDVVFLRSVSDLLSHTLDKHTVVVISVMPPSYHDSWVSSHSSLYWFCW